MREPPLFGFMLGVVYVLWCGFMQYCTVCTGLENLHFILEGVVLCIRGVVL